MNLKHDKADIITAGEKILREQGYHATGIKDILGHCNISKGTFYNYFPSKEQFGQEVIAYYGQRMYDYIRGFTEDHTKAPLRRLHDLYHSLADYAESEGSKKGCLLFNMSYEVGGTHDDLSKLLKVEYDRWIHLVRVCIREGQEAGEIIDSQDAGALALLVHTSVNGAYGPSKMSRSAAPMRSIIDSVLELIAV